MSQQAELTMKLTLSPELAADQPTHSLIVTARGILRRRAMEWSGTVASVPQKVCELTDVQGHVILVLVNDETPVAIRRAWLGHAFMSWDATRSLFIRKCTIDVIGHMRPEATYQESELSPVKFKSPDGLYPGSGTDRPIVYGLSVFSSPWNSGRAEIWLDVGTWRLALLEFEEDTVTVDIRHH